MRIDDSPFHRVWREPDEIDIAALRADRQADAEQAPGSPFWHPGPAAPTVLQQLPPAALTPPPPAPPPAPYVGEPPVDAAWLQQREQAFGAVRADFEAARAAAQADVGGAGWVDAVLVTDESGSTHSASGRATVFVPDSNAPPQQIGWDEGGPVYAAVTGRTLEFDEDAFAAHYRAQGGAPLQNLARLYDTDAGTLLARHPELWTVATHDHAINAGPPPAGRAMGDPGQLGMLDLYLADPQIAELIQTHGGRAAPASGGIALEQARIYGEQRYEQLTKLGNAMQAVRDDYDAALARAQSQGGPGWVDRPRMVTWTDESGARTTQPMVVYDESGQGTPVIDHVFDPDLFTDWYLAQDGVANRAFASFYGRSHSEFGTDESGRQFVTRIGFDNPNWEMWGIGGGMSHRELVRIDPNSPPRLNDNNAVGFDLEAGWATHHANIHHKRDWFETVVQVAIVAVAAWATGGAAATWATGAGYGATATAVISGAAAGAAASTVSGAMNGNLSFKGILQGALSGAITGGLLQGEIGAAVNEIAGPAGTIAFRGTVQGGINALLGGSFKDGMVAGVASGLADLAGASMNKGIDDAVQAGTMSAGEALAARSMARIFTSAVRVMGSPGDPQYAFASDLLNGLVNDGLNATRPTATPGGTVTGTVFDDDGNLMPGVVDPALPPMEQAARVRSLLIVQGVSADEATWLAAEAVFPPAEPVLGAPSPAAANWSPQELEARTADVERVLQEQIAAQQARDDSLLTPDDLLEPTGGGGPARAPIQPVLNGRFDAAMNAAADVAGLLEPLQGLRGDLARLESIQSEARIEGMRQAMRSAGMTNVPEDYVMSIDGNGRGGRDYGATADRLASAYEDFLRDQRLRANWGDSYSTMRLGRSQMTVQDFEAKVLEVQQRAANAAYERGKIAIATGELPLKNNDYILTLGTYVDQQVRFELRRFGMAEGLPDSNASVVFAVNRRISGNGMTGIPDLRIGQRLLSDTTLTPKSGTTEQLRRWNQIRPNDTLIIRPDALGGSYVVPRSTIRPVTPPGRGG